MRFCYCAFNTIHFFYFHDKMIKTIKVLFRQQFSALAVLPRNQHLIPFNQGFKVELNVQHDSKMIRLVTKAMTTEEKIDVFMSHKEILRRAYPNYSIMEKHY